MIIKETKVYGCEYCKKRLLRKYSMEQHEKFCESNPANNKACSMCKHIEEIEIIIGYEEGDRTAKGFRCKLLNQKLYPTKVERLKLPERFPDTFVDQKPMPKECELMELMIIFTPLS